jgi:hypothetical protein
MDTRRRGRRLLVVLALSALLNACGSQSGTGSAGSDTPYVPPEASDTPTVDPDEELIPDGPLFLAFSKWKPATTDTEQLNPCLRERLVVLGASKIRMRSFQASQGDARAQDLVAAFHDANAARQAAYLLRRWEETCKERLGDDGLRTTAPTSVGSGRGSAVWFTTTEDSGSGKSAQLVQSATGLAQVGQLVGLVTIQENVDAPSDASVQAMMERMLKRGQSRLG